MLVQLGSALLKGAMKTLKYVKPVLKAGSRMAKGTLKVLDKGSYLASKAIRSSGVRLASSVRSPILKAAIRTTSGFISNEKLLKPLIREAAFDGAKAVIKKASDDNNVISKALDIVDGFTNIPLI